MEILKGSIYALIGVWILFVNNTGAQSLKLIMKDASIEIGYDNKLIMTSVNHSSDENLLGNEPWAYDGINAPYIIEDIMIGDGDSWPFCFVECNGKLYFSAERKSTGREMWVYDGTNVNVIDIIPGTVGSKPYPLVSFKNKLWFYADDKNGVRHTYVLDETKTPNISEWVGSWGSLIYNNKMYSFQRDYENLQLWEYDGINNPKKLIDSLPIAFGIVAEHVVLNDKIIIIGGGGDSTKLYEVDLKKLSTRIVKENLRKNMSNGVRQPLITYKNKVYFAVNDIDYGDELWEYDGINTPKMTCNLSVTESSLPNYFTICNDKLYFIAEVPIYGAGGGQTPYIWEYDGVNKPIQFSKLSIFPEDLFAYNNKLYVEDPDGLAGSSDVYVLESLADINEHQDLSFAIFPNPSQDKLFVNLGEYTAGTIIEVADISGKQLIRQEAVLYNEVNTTNLLPGVYLVMIRSENSSVVKRFVKM